MSTLSGSFPKSAPGLPRGRSSLESPDLNARQRGRLLQAVMEAVAENGYPETTIGDIVRRARVSRTVLYREFEGKLDCFLAAIESGRVLLTDRVGDAIRHVPEGTLESVVEHAVMAYLQTCVAEPDHTKAWVLELTSAGFEGLATRERYLDSLAALMHEIDRDFGNGKQRSPEYYLVVVGGITELVARKVHAGHQEDLLQLESTMTEIIVAMLR